MKCLLPIALTLKHQTARNDQLKVVVDVSKVLSIGDFVSVFPYVFS